MAICCRLQPRNGWSSKFIERFEKLSRDSPHEIKFINPDSKPAIVQLFENGVLFEEHDVTFKNGSISNSCSDPKVQAGSSSSTSDNKISTDIGGHTNAFDTQFSSIHDTNKEFDDIIETMQNAIENLPSGKSGTTEMLMKFTESAHLNDYDIVVIRYVESPKLFTVQQTKAIAEYDAMMDKLSDSCVTAPTIVKPQIGMACAARYESEWYRAEIVAMSGTNAMTRFVDYGNELTIAINQLKQMDDEFLVLPKQAISCCLFGFESLDTTSTARDSFELLAENANGERRNLQVKIHGDVNGIALVNLLDNTQVPILDVSMRLLELTLPRNVFLEYKFKKTNKEPSAAPAPPGTNRFGLNSGSVKNLKARINGRNGDQGDDSTSKERPSDDVNFEEQRSSGDHQS